MTDRLRAFLPCPLAAPGTVMRYTEAYHQSKRFHRGAGWSDRQRDQFKVWEAAERAERWIVADCLPPGSEHNASTDWSYQLRHPDNQARIMYALPYNWEPAPAGEQPEGWQP